MARSPREGRSKKKLENKNSVTMLETVMKMTINRKNEGRNNIKSL